MSSEIPQIYRVDESALEALKAKGISEETLARLTRIKGETFIGNDAFEEGLTKLRLSSPQERAAIIQASRLMDSIESCIRIEELRRLRKDASQSPPLVSVGFLKNVVTIVGSVLVLWLGFVTGLIQLEGTKLEKQVVEFQRDFIEAGNRKLKAEAAAAIETKKQAETEARGLRVSLVMKEQELVEKEELLVAKEEALGMKDEQLRAKDEELAKTAGELTEQRAELDRREMEIREREEENNALYNNAKRISALNEGRIKELERENEALKVRLAACSGSAVVDTSPESPDFRLNFESTGPVEGKWYSTRRFFGYRIKLEGPDEALRRVSKVDYYFTEGFNAETNRNDPETNFRTSLLQASRDFEVVAKVYWDEGRTTNLSLSIPVPPENPK